MTRIEMLPLERVRELIRRHEEAVAGARKAGCTAETLQYYQDGADALRDYIAVREQAEGVSPSAATLEHVGSHVTAAIRRRDLAHALRERRLRAALEQIRSGKIQADNENPLGKYAAMAFRFHALACAALSAPPADDAIEKVREALRSCRSELRNHVSNALGEKSSAVLESIDEADASLRLLDGGA